MYEFLTSAKMFEARPPLKNVREAGRFNEQGVHVENLPLVRGGASLLLAAGCDYLKKSLIVAEYLVSLERVIVWEPFVTLYSS